MLLHSPRHTHPISVCYVFVPDSRRRRSIPGRIDAYPRLFRHNCPRSDACSPSHFRIPDPDVLECPRPILCTCDAVPELEMSGDLIRRTDLASIVVPVPTPAPFPILAPVPLPPASSAAAGGLQNGTGPTGALTLLKCNNQQRHSPALNVKRKSTTTIPDRNVDLGPSDPL